jgi:hypothetical protein
MMPKAEHAVFKALDPFFKVLLEGLNGLVGGKYYFDSFADDAVYESPNNFPDWSQTIHIRG